MARIASRRARCDDSSCANEVASIGDSPGALSIISSFASFSLNLSGLIVRYWDRSIPACCSSIVVLPAPLSPPAMDRLPFARDGISFVVFFCNDCSVYLVSCSALHISLLESIVCSSAVVRHAPNAASSFWLTSLVCSLYSMSVSGGRGCSSSDRRGAGSRGVPSSCHGEEGCPGSSSLSRAVARLGSSAGFPSFPGALPSVAGRRQRLMLVVAVNLFGLPREYLPVGGDPELGGRCYLVLAHGLPEIRSADRRAVVSRLDLNHWRVVGARPRVAELPGG